VTARASEAPWHGPQAAVTAQAIRSRILSDGHQIEESIPHQRRPGSVGHASYSLSTCHSWLARFGGSNLQHLHTVHATHKH
jgi:hypothetical protein